MAGADFKSVDRSLPAGDYLPFADVVALVAFGWAKMAIGLSDIDEHAAQLRAGVAIINAVIDGKIKLAGTPCERWQTEAHLLRLTGHRIAIGSLIPFERSLSPFVEEAYGQRACDLMSAQASNGPFGSPVFTCAGKTDPPSRLTPDIIDDYVIFGALMGAISWNLLTWALGIPSSSSHALIGGLVGAGIAKAGIGTVVWSGVIKTGSAVVFSPALGFVLALFLILAVSWIFVRRTPLAVDNIFRSLQFVSASFYSLGHGGNDAQKTMGIIAVLLSSHGKLGSEFHVPFWVVLSCQMAMGLGTLFGGRRIFHTMGSKITKLIPMQGFCAETGGAITLFLATGLGIPVSTTHTITGAIVGVGAARRGPATSFHHCMLMPAR
jgi:phosphate/sulfate permease